MNHTSRSVITATRKRKDRGGIDDPSFYTHKGNFVKPHYQPHPYINNISNTTSSSSSFQFNEPGPNTNMVSPRSSNRLLAGYMAHEFLTKGTLFGQKFDPARAEAVPVSAAESKRKPMAGPEVIKPSRSYADVAKLLKGDGVHIPGIVNPTQLAKWIQM